MSIFKTREDKTLSSACALVEQSLAERGPHAVRYIVSTFETLVENNLKEPEFEASALYESAAEEIERVRLRLIQFAFADLGQLQVTVFELGLNEQVRKYAQARIEPFIVAARKGVDEVASRLLA